MSIERDKDRFLQRKFLEQMLREIPIMEMLSVYSQTPRGDSSCGVFCALVPISAVADCLKDFSWDLSTSGGTPGAMTYWKDDVEHTDYLRFGDDDGIEPLVLRRSFDGVRKP